MTSVLSTKETIIIVFILIFLQFLRITYRLSLLETKEIYVSHFSPNMIYAKACMGYQLVRFSFWFAKIVQIILKISGHVSTNSVAISGINLPGFCNDPNIIFFILVSCLKLN